MAKVRLGLGQWQGQYEGIVGTWLRWYDAQGVLATGDERAEQERQWAEQERQRAKRESSRAAQLEAQLRALGIAPKTDPPA